MYVVYVNTLHLTDCVARSVDVGSVVYQTVFNTEDSICQNLFFYQFTLVLIHFDVKVFKTVYMLTFFNSFDKSSEFSMGAY
jgi:hypothetical protein